MSTRNDNHAPAKNGSKPKDQDQKDQKALIERATRVTIETYKKALKELEKH